MNELIKITESNGKRAVNARELHKVLKVKSKFYDWINNRIKQYDLIESIDYQILSKILVKIKQGKGAIESL